MCVLALENRFLLRSEKLVLNALAGVCVCVTNTVSVLQCVAVCCSVFLRLRTGVS